MLRNARVIDNKARKIAWTWMSEHEAHKLVDLLNEAFGYRRFRVELPGQLVGLD